MNYQEKQTGKYQDIFPSYASGLAIPAIEESVGSRVEEKVDKEGPIEKLFSSKTRTLKATVRELLNEINLRKNLDSDLVSRINDEICRTKTYLHEIGDICARRYDSEDLRFGRRRSQLEAQVIALEQEERKEGVECWRDLMFLKKYLMSALSDYWESSRKRDCLNYGFEESK